MKKKHRLMILSMSFCIGNVAFAYDDSSIGSSGEKLKNDYLLSAGGVEDVNEPPVEKVAAAAASSAVVGEIRLEIAEEENIPAPVVINEAVVREAVPPVRPALNMNYGSLERSAGIVPGANQAEVREGASLGRELRELLALKTIYAVLGLSCTYCAYLGEGAKLASLVFIATLYTVLS